MNIKNFVSYHHQPSSFTDKSPQRRREYWNYSEANSARRYGKRGDNYDNWKCKKKMQNIYLEAKALQQFHNLFPDPTTC